MFKEKEFLGEFMSHGYQNIKPATRNMREN